MSRIAQLAGSKAELYYRQIYFPVARNHWVLVEMKPHPDAVIKVKIPALIIPIKYGSFILAEILFKYKYIHVDNKKKITEFCDFVYKLNANLDLRMNSHHYDYFHFY